MIQVYGDHKRHFRNRHKQLERKRIENVTKREETQTLRQNCYHKGVFILIKAPIYPRNCNNYKHIYL